MEKNYSLRSNLNRLIAYIYFMKISFCTDSRYAQLQRKVQHKNLIMRKMKEKKYLYLIICMLLANVCFNSNTSAQEISDPELNFEYLWNTFDRNYALFSPKKVDWDALYRIYRPKVSSQTSDSALFDIMSNLLSHLNDNHVRLKSPNRSYQSGILGNIPYMDDFFPLLKGKYLHRIKRHPAGIFSGWLTDSIGYFHIQHFNDYENTAIVIDEILDEFKNTKGLVIDVRENYGGADELGKMIAGRFADQKRFYMTKRNKNGSSHTDFAETQYWYIEPEGRFQYTKPVILLINRFSISEAEVFTLAMRTLPQVTVIGDATSGVFADVYSDKLPNGWKFRCPYNLIEDNTGFCWEGIGIPADIRQTLTKKDIDDGHEKVIELSIELLNNGKSSPQKDKNSLINIRESLPDYVKQNIDSSDFNLLINKFLVLLYKYPDKYYINEIQTNELGNQLMAGSEIDNAILLFNLCTKEFPKSIVSFDNLVNAYIKKDEIELAKENIKKSMMINRQAYPWERDSYIENKNKLNELKNR